MFRPLPGSEAILTRLHNNISSQHHHRLLWIQDSHIIYLLMEETIESSSSGIPEEPRVERTEPEATNLAKLRREYSSAGIDDENTLDPNPLVAFQEWFDEACAANVHEPNAMCLATADKEGAPSARIMLLKGFDESGFVWFTNYESRKGQELQSVRKFLKSASVDSLSPFTSFFLKK